MDGYRCPRRRTDAGSSSPPMAPGSARWPFRTDSTCTLSRGGGSMEWSRTRSTSRRCRSSGSGNPPARPPDWRIRDRKGRKGSPITTGVAIGLPFNSVRVAGGGLEPPTLRLLVVRSNHLSSPAATEQQRKITAAAAFVNAMRRLVPGRPYRFIDPPAGVGSALSPGRLGGRFGGDEAVQAFSVADQAVP